MANFKAIYRFAQISAQKVRPFADLVRGKYADEAMEILSCYPNRGARLIEDVIHSALSNAMTQSQIRRVDRVEIVDIRIDSAAIGRRWRPKARGATSPYKKRSSHISVTVSDGATN
ncbi:MAG: 50S ribosomal protein L22 [Planctomycetaceae bacterium]|jgi:large subunit ribosomal protein L22|nr:50S ribosomal protein L22 [Planctomycetaceae bacterium]